MSPYPNANVRIKMWARISDVLDPHSERLFGFLIEPLLLRRADYTRNYNFSLV